MTPSGVALTILRDLASCIAIGSACTEPIGNDRLRLGTRFHLTTKVLSLLPPLRVWFGKGRRFAARYREEAEKVHLTSRSSANFLHLAGDAASSFVVLVRG